MLENSIIKNIVIVGGGTAGWSTAVALSRAINPNLCSITLIESKSIGTVGVGEATIPTMKEFHQLAGIDESAFIKASQATFKYGIQFENWGSENSSYIHPFGSYGANIGIAPFYHYWLQLKKLNKSKRLNQYSLCALAAEYGKFQTPTNDPSSPLSQSSYAYHLNAGAYAEYLRLLSEQRGVKRIEAKVDQVKLNGDDGSIESLILDSGLKVQADLFIDCSGFRALLIEQSLNAGFVDWSHFLLCDTAVTVQTEQCNELKPMTKATAHDAGWQWRIPLQTRTGNGSVFCSELKSIDQASNELLAGLDSPQINDTNVIRFKTGRRNKFWYKNCVAIGLSGGFLEPLESTSIHLTHLGISKLIELFPSLSVEGTLQQKYNEVMQKAYEQVRDFVILHYHATERNDSEFWNYCRMMEIPDSLNQKIELFRQSGRLFRENEELFAPASWLSVLMGQHFEPENYHVLSNMTPIDDVEKRLNDLALVIESAVEKMPTHREFLKYLINNA